jgi:hypothetical protein
MIGATPLPLKPTHPYLIAMDPVNLAMVLALDCSASVYFEEFGLMASGCAAGVRDPDVATGLLGPPYGASLLSVLLWSGTGDHAVGVDWKLVSTPAELEAFARATEDTPRLVRAGATAIGEALLEAGKLLALAPRPAQRLVIDVVGDGRSNQGEPPGPIRDRLVAAGVTINGLCVLHDEADLLESYTNEVIGGPGAFALQCQDYQSFAAAMRQKLVREIA